MSDDDEQSVSRCRHCLARIIRVNFALGAKWMHQDAGKAFQDDMYWHCRITTAGPVVDAEAGLLPDCPDHNERQHRDRKPPWCDICGWNHGSPAVPPRQLGSTRAEREQRRKDAADARLGDVP